jgi:glycosyltransferase involved in cell wall biosynthesis
MLGFGRKTCHFSNLLILDGQFPQMQPFGFRNTEFNQYLEKVPGASFVTIPSGLKWDKYNVGCKYERFLKNFNGYLESFPQFKDKISYLNIKDKYCSKLAYSLFLNETYAVLPFLERNKIPFIFTLYPGGGFFVEDRNSDEKIKRIVSSKYFRKVIVTQNYTKKYLIDNNLCSKDKIEFIYTCYSQFSKKDILLKKKYPYDKESFDICFVAFKYMIGGLNKGYDLFLKSATILSEIIPEARFHIVGNWEVSEIDMSGLSNKFSFYGNKHQDFFPEFYSNMDIFLSPNRPFVYLNQFDGFPLGADAGCCGTALFVSDELNMNIHFKKDRDIVIIPLNVEGIVSKVMEYYNDLERLYLLSRACQEKCLKLFDYSFLSDRKIKLFNKYIDQVGLS